jgi:hypothetical protein
MKRIVVACLAALGLVALCAEAQTLYKLIDKNGKVTYSEKAPKEFDGKVIRMDIDPKANTATLPKGSAVNAQGDGARATQSEDRIDKARAALEAARKALQEARDNPGPDEVNRIGNKGGGTRPQPTEQYQRKLEQLEQAVRNAEEELKDAQQSR